MRISAASAETGVSARLLRYYEEGRGVLVAAPTGSGKTPSNWLRADGVTRVTRLTNESAR